MAAPDPRLVAARLTSWSLSPGTAAPTARRYTVAGVSGSRTTLAGRLARMGFADAARAERLLRTDLRAIDPDPQGAEFGDAGDRPKPDAVLAAAADG